MTGPARPPFAYLAFDLDGTLLGGDAKIADDIVRGLSRVRSLGYRLLVASGRSPSLVRPLGLAPQGLDLFEPTMVLRDGDIVWNWRTDTVESLRTMPHEVIARLAAHPFPDFVVDTGPGLVASSRLAATGHAAFYGCARSTIAVAAGPPAVPAVKVTIYAEPAQVRAALHGIDGCTFDVANEGKRCSVVPAGSCKTIGVTSVLARHYREPSLARLVAFGDGENDACLLRCAGAGVAMAVADAATARHATIQLTGPLAEYLNRDFPAGLDSSRGDTSGGCRHGRGPAAAGRVDHPAEPAG